MTFFTEKSAKIQNQNSQNFNTRLRRGKQAKIFFSINHCQLFENKEFKGENVKIALINMLQSCSNSEGE